jgi:hypothetical protein
MTRHPRLVTVLLTLAVPDEADPDDAAGLAATAAEWTALQVVSAAGVEGYLPVPGALVVLGGGDAPWRVRSVHDGSAVIADLAGQQTRVPLSGLRPDLLAIDRLS